eukprot:TRINITY_DN17072_c0_g1_i1.p2 TRINITY_DN17072_c0_g1~~TRINITY_DN17072_c0_g1_i1.p2  ORF type:complete len:250 (+),score=79.42 TRINITY_DN17072_c0_g1_i1:114-863(+)
MLRRTPRALWRPTAPLLHYTQDEYYGRNWKIFRTGPSAYIPANLFNRRRMAGELRRPLNNTWGHPYLHRGGEMWRVVDAKDREVEGLAEQLVAYLIGRHRPDWQRGKLMGDQLVILNCRRVSMDDNEGTPLPWRMRPYAYNTGYAKSWGVQIRRADEEFLMDPCRPLWLAIKERLPERHPVNKIRAKGTMLKRFWMEKVHCFPDEEHPFKEMNPIPLEFPIETVGTEQWHALQGDRDYIPRKQKPQGWK